jgi:hypothetical protein
MTEFGDARPTKKASKKFVGHPAMVLVMDAWA